MLKEFLHDKSEVNQPARNIYLHIYRNEKATQLELTEATKLKRLKVTKILQELLDKKYIEKAGYGKSSGGRPPVIYRINQTNSYIIGVNVTRSVLEVGLYDLYLQPLLGQRFAMSKEFTPDYTIDRMIETIHSMMAEKDIGLHQLLGIGISSIGPIDKVRGVLDRPGLFLAPDWDQEIPIVDRLKEHFPVRVLLEYVGTSTVMGCYQNNHYHQNSLFFTNGWKIGYGMILNGQVINKKHDDAGINHFIVDPNGKQCECGKKGCVSAYSSLQSMVEYVEAYHPTVYAELQDENSYVNIEKMMEKVQEMKALQEYLKESAHYLGLCIASMANALNATFITLGGPFVKYVPQYFGHVKRSIEHYLFDASRVEIVKKQESVEVKGAAEIVLNSFIEEQARFHYS